MNDFIAKKLGEVLAFSIVGKETFEKGREAFEGIFGDELKDLIEKSEKRSKSIKDNLSESEREITLAKSDKTSEKLRHMREFYIGDEWDNPAELLEWSGFFEGAALIHWKLIEGVSENSNDPKIRELAKEGIEFHKIMIDKVSEKIKKIGFEKSKTA